MNNPEDIAALESELKELLAQKDVCEKVDADIRRSISVVRAKLAVHRARERQRKRHEANPYRKEIDERKRMRIAATVTRRNEVLRMREMGIPFPAIAEHFGISRSSVRAIEKRALQLKQWAERKAAESDQPTP